MTSKKRAILKSRAMTMDPIFQIGKASVTPEMVTAVSEALAARELIKLSVLQNCGDDPRELAQILAERTKSQVVQVIGKKIVLYRENKDPKKKGRGEKNATGTKPGAQSDGKAGQKRPADRAKQAKKSGNHGRNL